MPQSVQGSRRLRMPTFRRPWRAIVRRCARAALAAWVLNFFVVTADAGAAMKLLLICFLGMIATVFGIVYFDGFVKHGFQAGFALVVVLTGFFFMNGQID
jgi:hypothetical protein